jgi:hypothetical protein
VLLLLLSVVVVEVVVVVGGLVVGYGLRYRGGAVRGEQRLGRRTRPSCREPASRCFLGGEDGRCEPQCACLLEAEAVQGVGSNCERVEVRVVKEAADLCTFG